VNILYVEKVIGEIKFKYGPKGRNYEPNQFLSKLAKANSIFDLRINILERINEYAESGQIYMSTFTDEQWSQKFMKLKNKYQERYN
jgi:hypothetical protein